MTTAVREQIVKLMEVNRRTHDGLTYTLPSPLLYPFQWLWDSCFHAIIYSYFDTDAAEAELNAVCSRPLPSGMLPHIIYHRPPDPTAPAQWGREERGDVIDNAWGTVGTSSITQPCIIALAIRRVYEVTRNKEWLLRLYPIVRAHFDYLENERASTEYSPLLIIVNPDESGEDNSPRFDSTLGLPPQHVAGTHLDSRIHLIRAYAQCNFQVNGCMTDHFSIIDVPFNILYAEDLLHLAALATYLGDTKQAERWIRQSQAVKVALRKHLWKDWYFKSLDTRTGEHIEVATWSHFMPLYGGLLSESEAHDLVTYDLEDSTMFRTKFGLPTTAQNESSYDPVDGFWRGPIWHAPHWFLYHGLKRYGYTKKAEEIKDASMRLIEQSDFYEQYNPHTGEGYGAKNFTWGGLVIDMV